MTEHLPIPDHKRLHVTRLELRKTGSVWYPALFTQTKTSYALQWKLSDTVLFPLCPVGIPDT